jgi:hypothetical protein
MGKRMIAIEYVLIAWMTVGSDAVELDTYRQHEPCETVAESITEPNPEDGDSPYVVAMCVERDK